MTLYRLFASEQSHVVWLLVISVVASIINISTSAPAHGHQDLVEITLLEEAWNSDHRSRRDADSNLPNRLSFAVPVASDRAVLNMVRSRLLPVIMSDEESTRAANSFSEGAAVYTDLSSSSSMIVKQQSGNYMLRGSFVHKDVAWTLKYETRYKRDASNITSVPHLVSHLQAPKRSFVGDTLEFSGVMPAKYNSIEPNTREKDTVDTEVDPSSEKPVQHVVEIAFVVDYADYTKWVEYAGKEDVRKEMRLWYTFVAESINIRYQNIKDPDISIRTTVTILRILNDVDDEGLFANLTHNDYELDGENGLDNFSEWYYNQTDLPESDHYMLFTGLKLVSNMSGLDGIAEGSSLCTDYAVSICVNDFSENTGATAAHELAHSISAEHDGDDNQCSAEDVYVMAPGAAEMPIHASLEGHTWQFSSCSIKYFKKYLSNVTCTRQMSSEKPALPAPLPGERAGEVLSRDDQCRLWFQDSDSTFNKTLQVYNTSSENVCLGMACSIPGATTFYYIMPQEFTPCGDNKSTKQEPKWETNELKKRGRPEETLRQMLTTEGKYGEQSYSIVQILPDRTQTSTPMTLIKATVDPRLRTSSYTFSLTEWCRSGICADKYDSNATTSMNTGTTAVQPSPTSTSSSPAATTTTTTQLLTSSSLHNITTDYSNLTRPSTPSTTATTLATSPNVTTIPLNTSTPTTSPTTNSVSIATTATAYTIKITSSQATTFTRPTTTITTTKAFITTTTRSQLSTLASSVTTIVSMTFGLCLFYLSVL